MTAPVAAAARPPAGTRLERLRWWRLDEVLDAELDLFGDEAWSEELFWTELGQVETRCYLAAVDTADGSLLGYAGIALHPDEGFVQNIAVVARAQGRRLGSALLDALLAEADARALPLVGLEVRADNAAAQRLYVRRGFATVGVRRGYYQPSGADALVMVRQLPEGAAAGRGRT